MTTEDALLAAIWESPHDDLPRLVYADFLDESGDPAKAARAEFIRVQCELAKLSGREDERWVPLKSAEMRLLKRYGDGFRRGVGGKVKRAPFRRGFIAPGRQLVTLHYLLDCPEGVLQQAPLWELLVNHNAPAQVLPLFASPRLRRVGYLGIWAMNDVMATALAASPHALNLAGIDFRRGTVTAVGMQALAHSSNLPHLHELTVSLARPDWLDLRFARELVDSPLGDRLRVLDIADCSTVAPAAEELLRERFGDRLVSGRPRTASGAT